MRARAARCTLLRPPRGADLVIVRAESRVEVRRVCVCARARAHVCACVCLCVRVCARAGACVVFVHCALCVCNDTVSVCLSVYFAGGQSTAVEPLHGGGSDVRRGA